MNKRHNGIFEKNAWRRATPQETAHYTAMLDAQFGKDRHRLKPGPKPNPKARYIPTYIKLHPKIVLWAKNLAKRRGIGYQTVINETLLGVAIKA